MQLWTLSTLKSKQTPTQQPESLPLLREEAEDAVHSLKAGKSPGMDNIPSELLKNGSKKITSPDSNMEDLRDKGMVEGVDTIANHTFTIEWQPQAMSEV